MTIISADRDGGDVDEENDWKNYKNKTGKKYNSTDDGNRKKIFAQRRNQILANNKNNSSPFKMDFNHFSDLSDREWQAYMFQKVPGRTTPSSVTAKNRADTVTTTTPVKKSPMMWFAIFIV